MLTQQAFGLLKDSREICSTSAFIINTQSKQLVLLSVRCTYMYSDTDKILATCVVNII